MPGTYTKVKTAVTGEVITAADRNAEHDNHIANADPDGIGDASANAAEMRATADPFPAGVESLATSDRGEKQRMRYILDQLNKTQYWYIHPDLKAIDNTDSPYSASQNERIILADATSGAITINLPAVSGLKDSKDFIIKKIDSSANAVTIDGNSGENIDGALTQILGNQYDTIHIARDGSNWAIVSTLKSKGGITQQTFTASSTFVVPIGITEVLVTAIGGGGGGGGAGGATTGINAGGAGGGGGGGRFITDYSITSLTPGSSITVTIGGGGAGGAGGAYGAVGTAGSAGDSTVFGGHITLAGGSGGAAGGAGGGDGAGGANGGGTASGAGGSASAGANGLYGNGGAANNGSGGGGSPYADGAAGASGAGNGADATSNSGAGGGGGAGQTGDAGTDGGDGGSGILIVKW